MSILNSSDGIYFYFYTIPTSVAQRVTFSFLQLESNFGMSELFVLSDGLKGEATTSSDVVVVNDGTNYKVEGFVPADIFDKSKTPIQVSEGETLGFANIVMAHDGINQSLYIICGS